MTEIKIIAEAGVNHNGSPEMAFRLVDVAVESGADAVKFQTFKAERLVTKYADKTDYQKETTQAHESHYEMIRSLELPYETHFDLMGYCNERGIMFLSTAFDIKSIRFLSEELQLETLKIPSGEITNGPLLLAYGKTGKNLILSTGMASLGEIERALGVLAFGLTGKSHPSLSSFDSCYRSEEGQEALKKHVTLLHCTTEYPAPFLETNLRAMKTMRKAFALKVGYSDHTEGIAVATAAAGLGATVIEKHFTLDRNLPGPDHKASLEPEELKSMVNAVRIVEDSMGDGRKHLRDSEVSNCDVVRKSLVASRPIVEGGRFTADNLAIKRPGLGRSPMEYWDILGTKSNVSYMEDELIR